MEDMFIFFLAWLIPAILLRLVFRTGLGKLPPSPLAFPIIGHLHLLGSIPHQALHTLSKRHGPLMYLRLGSVPCVVASSAEVAKEFLKTHETSFLNRSNSIAIDYISHGYRDFTYAPYGPYWKFVKKVVMSQLLGGKTLDLLRPIRQDEMRRFVEKLCQKAITGVAVDVGSELSRFTNNVVSRMAISRRCSEGESEAGEIKKSVKEVAELIGKFNLSDYIWFCKNLDLQGFRKRSGDVMAVFDTMTEKIMVEHEEVRMKRKLVGDEPQVKDLLDILMDISEDESSEVRLSRESIKAVILDMFAAGTDISAVAIEWALSELINHPDVMEKATREIDLVIGNDRLVEESDIANLPYLEAIVKESLRLHPTGPIIPRESTKDCQVGGYHILEKTRLLINEYAIGRDPNHWENPLEFRPERFIGGDQKLDVRGQHFQFLPFGSGRRVCPGTSLALQIVQTTLATMIQCFEWKIKMSEGDDGKVDMEEGSGGTLPRAHPLVCFPVARQNSPVCQLVL